MVQLLLDVGAGLGKERDPLSPPLGPYECPQPSALYVSTGCFSRHGIRRMEQLLLAGANVNTVDGWGWSALHKASCYGYLGAVELLLRHNDDAALLTDDGRTAEELAMKDVPGLGPVEDEEKGMGMRALCAFTTEQVAQADELRAIFRRASAWGRRGRLVVARNLQPAHTCARSQVRQRRGWV